MEHSRVALRQEGQVDHSWSRHLLRVLGLGLGLALLVCAPSRAQIIPSDSDASVRNAPGGLHEPLGPAPGAGGGTLGDSPGDAGLLLNAGPRGGAGPRVSSDITGSGRPFSPDAPAGIVRPRSLPIKQPPLYGSLELPEEGDDQGPSDGMTLDDAIEHLVHANLDLRTQYFEIPQAEADILTASLRANPLFFADATAIPYGNYTRERPGGQTQYDVSITHPLDLSRKRAARTLVASRAKHVLEAQYQDAVRIQIDNLYTTFVDVLSARETVRFSRASVRGLSQLRDRVEELRKEGQKTEAEVNAVRVQLAGAEIGLEVAQGRYRTTLRALGWLLNIPQRDAERLKVRGSIRILDAEPPPDAELVSIAMENRPDVTAFRLGIARAEADVRLAEANKLADFYLMYAPYVFQNNAPFGQKSAHSWSVAITAPVPIYNRNQGNIARSKLNVHQTRAGLDALEQRVIHEVLSADQEYDDTRAAVERIERELIPAARQVRDAAFRQYTGGEASILTYLEAQRDFNETVREYRDMLTRHRRGMLDLNTALGRRVLP